ncbi:aminoglycoside 6-adenylyltransferase [Pseudobacter ginsenosidimutans]|uniref:Aminoglycoside 6-adenylyltransferase n=1 Tax=Pseudobacter ginsenosidimutans TaxID=661488 RepID=A0A4Q7MS40_9BACT|nr:aminoglycoside 6-adenylyltransferase [Pseudobacter ginsenosidimutans]QEC42468.1 aminoglycoside adenylyltransferase [Pseudobacter ginsenosidimutans]RZS70679.1 aminoglycoside 6-adenylyltransferase [Pseudobacter ginsenosidimutans]
MTNDRRASQLNEVILWATAQPNIRAALLTSSLTNPIAPVDAFSDLDIDLVVDNYEEFLQDDSWISNFGSIITTIVEGEEPFDGRCSSRMVLYEDYSKIDFLIFSVNKFREEVTMSPLHEDWDIGYKVLVDKDGLTTNMPSPTHSAFNIQKPDEEKFLWVLNNYWWDMTYVAKCLARDELYYAKFMSEQIMRFEHQQVLLEWYIGSQHNWNVTTNKYGRLFKKYLSAEMWQRATATFAGADLEDNWRALFAYAELGREIGQYLSSHLGYPYPSELDRKITAYLLHARAGGLK